MYNFSVLLCKKSVELGLLFRVFIKKLLKYINILVCNFPGSNLILDISRVKTILGSLETFLFWFYAFEFITYVLLLLFKCCVIFGTKTKCTERHY